MFETFSRSWALVKSSFYVLRKDKELMLFPLVSGILSIIMFISLIIPSFYFIFITKTLSLNSYVFYGLLFIYYLLSSFIILFFNSGLVACARIRLRGGDPKFSDGIKAAMKHVGKIFQWALVSATVGIVLRMISDRSTLIGRIIASIIGAAWSLVTFFVVPVLIFENLGIKDSIKQSWELFKRTWGENFIGGFSMSIIIFLFALVGFLPMAIGMYTFSLTSLIAGIAISMIYWVALIIIITSLDGIFLTALYEYASTGKVPEVYDEDTVKNAFKPKKGKSSQNMLP